MTAKVVLPDKYELRGIFTIEREDLLELDAILRDVEKDYKRNGAASLNQAVAKYLSDLGLDPEKNRERIKKDLKARYPFRDNGMKTEISCASNKKLSGRDFASILESADLASERPLSAEVTLKYGDVGLKITLLGEFVVNCIDISVSSNPAFAQRAVSRIRQWADERRRFDHLRGFAFPLGIGGFGLLIFALLLSPDGLFTTASNKSDAIAQTRQLIQGGLEEKELPQAFEFMLRFYVNDFTTITRFDLKPWFVTLLIIGAGLLLFGIFCPKSIIVVGKNVRRLKFSQFFYGQIWVWVIAWVTAVLTSALGSNLYEYIRDTYMTNR